MFRRRVRTRIDCALLAVLLVPGPIWAQNGGSGNQETISQLVEQIKQLQQEDRDLQARIAILERRQVQTPPVPEPDPATAAIPPQSAEQTASAPAPVPTFDWHNLHGIQWRGFGEVNYKVLDQRRPELGTEGFVPGSAGNFYTGDFDLFLSAKLNDKASVLSEIALGEFDDQTFTVDLERFLSEVRVQRLPQDVVWPVSNRHQLLQHSISQRQVAANYGRPAPDLAVRRPGWSAAYAGRRRLD